MRQVPPRASPSSTAISPAAPSRAAPFRAARLSRSRRTAACSAESRWVQWSPPSRSERRQRDDDLDAAESASFRRFSVIGRRS